MKLTLPTLYRLNSRGVMRTWTIAIEESPDGEFSTVTTTEGYIGCTAYPAVWSARVSKRNKASAFEYAAAQARAKWQSRLGHWQREPPINA